MYYRLSDIQLAGKNVLYRGPYNLPVDSGGKVIDDNRARRSLSSLEYLLKEGAHIVIASHLGRPKGKVVESLRMAPVAKRLQDILHERGFNVRISMFDLMAGEDLTTAVDKMGQDGMLFLENLRFIPGEYSNEPEFSRRLAAPFHVCVQDSTDNMHRHHASMVGVADYIPSVAGVLFDEEILTLNKLLEPPPNSIMALGGSKVTGKIQTIEGLIDRWEFVVGGAMANTFLHAIEFGVGRSYVEVEFLDRIKYLLERKGDRIHLPIDVVAASDFAHRGSASYQIVRVVAGSKIPEGYLILDTGPETNKRNIRLISNASGLVAWNGPFGVYELGYVDGTKSIAEAMNNRNSVVLGGDTYAATKALNHFVFGYVVVSGGSGLIFLEKRGSREALPGLAALETSRQRLESGYYGQRAKGLLR